MKQLKSKNYMRAIDTKNSLSDCKTDMIIIQRSWADRIVCTLWQSVFPVAFI